MYLTEDSEMDEPDPEMDEPEPAAAAAAAPSGSAKSNDTAPCQDMSHWVPMGVGLWTSTPGTPPVGAESAPTPNTPAKIPDGQATMPASPSAHQLQFDPIAPPSNSTETTQEF